MAKHKKAAKARSQGGRNPVGFENVAKSGVEKEIEEGNGIEAEAEDSVDENDNGVSILTDGTTQMGGMGTGNDHVLSSTSTWAEVAASAGAEKKEVLTSAEVAVNAEPGLVFASNTQPVLAEDDGSISREITGTMDLASAYAEMKKQLEAVKIELEAVKMELEAEKRARSADRQSIAEPEKDMETAKKTCVSAKKQNIMTDNTKDNAIKKLEAKVSSLEATNKFQGQQLKEEKEKNKGHEAKEPITKVGAAVINRQLELAKVPMFGLRREDLDNKIISAGNKAAHDGNMLVHKALFDTKLCRIADGHRVFRKLYRLPYEDQNPVWWSAILLRTVNLNVTYLTTNDGEGAREDREEAKKHVNTLFKLWKERIDDHTFETSKYARVELSLLEKVVEKIVHTRHNYEWIAES